MGSRRGYHYRLPRRQLPPECGLHPRPCRDLHLPRPDLKPNRERLPKMEAFFSSVTKMFLHFKSAASIIGIEVVQSGAKCIETPRTLGGEEP